VATFGISKEAASQNLDNSTTHKKDSIETIKKINPESHQVVNDKVRNDWNQFSAWMDEQGMKGNSELDKNGLGYKYFDKYVKTHQTTLNRSMLPLLVQEFENLRSWELKNIDEGKAIFKGDRESFMRTVSENKKTHIPAYPGKEFTNTTFPKEFMLTMKGKDVDSQQIGSEVLKSKDLEKSIKGINMVNKKITNIEDKGFVKTINYNDALDSYNKNKKDSKK
jgi:hypothetical protein